MQLLARKTIPNFARRGQVRHAPRNIGRVLILLGQAERVKPPAELTTTDNAVMPVATRAAEAPRDSTAPKRAPRRRAPRKTTTDTRPDKAPGKGRYRRRDMTATDA